MKKLFVFAVLAGLMFFAAGCGKEEEGKNETEKNAEILAEKGWYPFDGGYINLANVKVISSGIGTRYRDEVVGAITPKNVKEYKNNTNVRNAYISFDGFKVYIFNLADPSVYEVNAGLDKALKAMEDLEKRLCQYRQKVQVDKAQLEEQEDEE